MMFSLAQRFSRSVNHLTTTKELISKIRQYMDDDHFTTTKELITKIRQTIPDYEPPAPGFQYMDDDLDRKMSSATLTVARRWEGRPIQSLADGTLRACDEKQFATIIEAELVVDEGHNGRVTFTPDSIKRALLKSFPTPPPFVLKPTRVASPSATAVTSKFK